MKIIIRNTREKDYNQIKKLLKTQRVSANFTEQKFKKMIKRNKGFYLVAEADGKIVGTVFGLYDGGLLGSIYKIAVAKEFQRQKIGTRLCRELLKRLKKLGVELVYAHVHKVNKKSVSFLKKLGFRVRNDIFLMDTTPK
ncbi:GNAT family N-acetyltransferase [Patescibacteria group bacterium]|nr:GNAT family N-acetyltransferase [Patescibacteria group bacterium]